MGDRTYVNLYIPAELADAARPILDEYDSPECELDHGDLVCFGINEVNYASLECENLLREAGIPYTKQWYAGCEYEAGEEHLRFTEAGEAVYLEVFNEDKGVRLDKLEQALERNEDADPILEALGALGRVERLAASHKAKTVPLPWDNQVEYGRRHVAAQQEKQQ